MSELDMAVAHALGLDLDDVDERREAKAHAEWIERIVDVRLTIERERLFELLASDDVRDAIKRRVPCSGGVGGTGLGLGKRAIATAAQAALIEHLTGTTGGGAA